MSIDRQRPDRRQLRAGMVFVLVLAGTALIGWGGLAAWQAYTQNNGSTASTLGVHMSNTATVSLGTPKTCTDQAGPCGLIFDASQIEPGWGPNAVGTVTITNTGSESSTFGLSLASAVVTGDDTSWNSSLENTLCGDLSLTISGLNTTNPTVYSGPLSALPSTNIFDSGSNGTWVTGASNTFTFSLSLPAGAAHLSTDEDSTCTAAFTWSQNGA
jgi:hypothetical protein